MEALTDREGQVLRSLQEFGALTPSEISVKTYLLPDEVEAVLKELQDKGLVKRLSLAERAQAVEREVCAITSEGRRWLKPK